MLDELKDELELEGFFAAMGATKLRPTSRGFSMRCLHPTHNDSGPSFHYRSDIHKFRCYGCGFNGDVIDIVMAVKNLKFRRAISWLKDWAGWSSEITTKQLQVIIERREKQRNGGNRNDDSDTVVVFPAYYQSDFSSAGDVIQSYVCKRKWDTALLDSLGVGYTEHGYFRNRIVFPVYNRDGSRLTTFSARATWDVDEDAGERRYEYPLNSFLSKSIWPLHVPSDGIPIFLEGCPDALRLREYGHNAYACLGNQLGEDKLDLIRYEFRRHKKLIIIPDEDLGGKYLFEWFGKLIHEFEILVATVRWPDGELIHGPDDILKDIDEVGFHFGRELVDQIIDAAVPYHEVYIRNRFNFKKPPKMVTELVKDQKVMLPSKVDKRSLMNRMWWAVR
jgi:DNA primase